MTRIEMAKERCVSDELRRVAGAESRDVSYVVDKVACGEIVVLRNKGREIEPLAVGSGLRTKVNANIGTSPDRADLELELAKLEMAIDAGADTVMDLSTGGDISSIRRAVIENSSIAVGTVPIYQAACRAAREKGTITAMTEESIFEAVEEQLDDGVDFITVHCGVTQRVIDRLRKGRRVMPCVSRGGSLLLSWMMYNERENPLYEHYDELLRLAKRYDVTLSLGDGMRPGAIADASDAAQMEELFVLSELAERALEMGVQVMIEGPGHVPLDQVRMNVELQKRTCHNAPFYVLGPLVTDVAPGYDHIGTAIGGALAASCGADFLCYVTGAEHVRLPDPGDVYEGVVVTRMAAHAADVAKGVPGAFEWDLQMSKARADRDWRRQEELALDPAKLRKMKAESQPAQEDTCTMCGEFCALKMVQAELELNE